MAARAADREPKRPRPIVASLKEPPKVHGGSASSAVNKIMIAAGA